MSQGKNAAIHVYIDEILILILNYRFEAGGQGQHSIQRAPVLKGATFSRAEAVGWLESVTAALDSYNWVLREQLFAPSELFHGKFVTVLAVIII